MKQFCLGLLGVIAGTAQSQTLPPQLRSTVILGAGRAGTWDTTIVVSNVSTHALPITITTLSAPTCISPPCNVLASTTISPEGTFILPSIPMPEAPASSAEPQAVLVNWPTEMEGPAVVAFASDGGVVCNRLVALPVLINAFFTGTVVFPIHRDTASHVNLIVMKGVGPDDSGVLIDAFDASGAHIGSTGYSMTANQTSVFAVDVLRQLGVEDMEQGSLHVTPARTVFPTSTAAVAMIVGTNGVQAVQGTPIIDVLPP